jgi:hypothetical protein
VKVVIDGKPLLPCFAKKVTPKNAIEVLEKSFGSFSTEKRTGLFY